MIRFAKETDIPAILNIYAPYIETSTATFEYDVPSGEEFLQRFREITAEFPWLVWEEQGKILGYAYACHPFQRTAYSWCAEPSIYLHPEAQGKGIGRKFFEFLTDDLKGKLKRIRLEVGDDNEGAKKLYKNKKVSPEEINQRYDALKRKDMFKKITNINFNTFVVYRYLIAIAITFEKRPRQIC
mgnify:CR=1 FL=1